MFQVVLFENPGRSISIKENNLKFIYFLQYWHTSYSFCLHFQLLWEAEHRVDQWAPARTSHPPDYICPSRHAHTDTGTTDPETPWAQTTIIPTTTTSHEGKCSKTKNSHQKWDCLYKLRKTVFRYWMYGMTQVRSDFDWSTSYLLHTKNFMYCQFFVGLPLMSSTNSPKCSNMSAVQGKESFPQP